MPDFIDCKYEENFINRLEQITEELNFLPLGDQSEEDTIILSFNTRILNRKLVNYRQIQNSIAKVKRVLPTTKQKFAERFIPNRQLSRDFLQARINTADDLIRFVNENRLSFFDNQINTSEDAILEKLRDISPTTFNTFGAEFPNISTRIQSGQQLSSAEVRAFINQNGFDPRSFANNVENNTLGILNLLEGFLSSFGIGLGIMGSVCSLLNDIFSTVKSQRDISGPASDFMQNYQNVLGLINPDVAEVIGDVQGLISLMQQAQENSIDIISNFQQAFSLLASAFGIIMQFKDILDAVTGDDQTAESSLSVDWNFELIRDAIDANDTRFQTIIQRTNKPLGDINQDGVMNTNDADALQTYIDSTATNEVKSYINTIFVPHLNANTSTFSDFINFPSAQQPDSGLADIADKFSSVVDTLGAGPGSGDFGLSKILEIISIASGLISSIQGLVGGSRPVNIQSIFEQLDQIVDLGTGAVEDIFADFAEQADEYREIVEDALEEAEEIAVENKPKAKEISDNHKESLEEPYTEALETSAEAPKLLQTALIDHVRAIKNGIRGIAAVGVLDQLAEQLMTVVDQSAAKLKSKAEMFSPESLDNGYHFNIQSSYAKMAGLIATAKNTASDDVTEEMKDSLKGMIAQSSEKFRQKNKEEVEYVALRFCKMAGEIERVYDEVTAPIEAMINNFQATNRLLAGIGNDVTLRAVLAGAIRYDTQTRLAAMQQAGTIDATIAAPFINAAGQRSIDPGEGTQSTGLLPPLPADYEFPTYEEALRGARGVRYQPGEQSSRMGPRGFLTGKAGGVDEESLRRLYNLARSWGREIVVISAHRNAEVNRDAGGVANSNHIIGTAFDITMPTSINIRERVRFCNFAYNAKLQGIIVYSWGIHIAKSTEGQDELTIGRGGDFNYFHSRMLTGPLGNRTLV